MALAWPLLEQREPVSRCPDYKLASLCGPSSSPCPTSRRAGTPRSWRKSRPRRNLAGIRKGEVEGFTEKMKDGKGKHDFGPEAPHSTAGVVAVGARQPLIAYNINLGTREIAVAEAIAKAIRSIGGGFRYVKAMGVALADRGQVQVSINMTNFKKTPLHRVFECVKSEAERYGVPVVGSEIVGLTPAEALVMTAEHYLRLENFSSDQVLETRLLEEGE